MRFGSLSFDVFSIVHCIGFVSCVKISKLQLVILFHVLESHNNCKFKDERRRFHKKIIIHRLTFNVPMENNLLHRNEKLSTGHRTSNRLVQSAKIKLKYLRFVCVCTSPLAKNNKITRTSLPLWTCIAWTYNFQIISPRMLSHLEFLYQHKEKRVSASKH